MATRRRIEVVKPAESAQRFFPTGCALLDCVLGGGWAHGKVINVVGDKSTGKTLLAIEACANFARSEPSGRTTYIEAESAFDRTYATTLGFPEHGLDLVDDIGTVEALWARIEALTEASVRTPQFVVLDSLDALSDDAEIERETGDASYGGAKSKLLSEGFRKNIRKMNAANITLMVISQIRDKIGAMKFAKQVQRSGGHALDFYASQVLWLYETGKIYHEVGAIKRAIGVNIKARCEKNKVGWPWRECEVPIIYGYGMDDVPAGLDFIATAKPEALAQLGVEELKKTNWKRHAKKLDRAAVGALVRTVWEEVDAQFRPESRKYT